MLESLTNNSTNINYKKLYQKEKDENSFDHNIYLLYDILKEIQKEQNNNIYNEIDKTNIDSLFYLLYFELVFLQ